MARDRVRDPETVLAHGLQAAVAQYMAGGRAPAPTWGEVLALQALERIAAGEVRLRDTRAAARQAVELVAGWRRDNGGGNGE